MNEYPIYHAKRRGREARRRKSRAIASSAGTVVTVLDPGIRSSLDMAMDASCIKVHVNSVSEAINAVRQHSAGTVLLSPNMVRETPLDSIAKLVVKNPGVLAVAIVDDSNRDANLLDLGACGVRQLIDVSEPEGWSKIRGLVEDAGGEVAPVILNAVLATLVDATDETKYFFGTLVRLAPKTSTVRRLSAELHSNANTLSSRFFRASLPAPKSYLVMTRLLYAAAFFEIPKATIVGVAYRLGFSSPQGFGRHVRTLLGLTAGEFRRELPLCRAVDHFAERLITPYRQTLQGFDPFGGSKIVPKGGH